MRTSTALFTDDVFFTRRPLANATNIHDVRGGCWRVTLTMAWLIVFSFCISVHGLARWRLVVIYIGISRGNLHPT